MNYKILKEIRKSKGFTQAQMAKFLGYTHKSGYCMLENGLVNMTIDKANILMKLLEIDPKVFFEDEGGMEVKYKVGDRVKTNYGYGNVENIIAAKKSIPFDLYKVHLEEAAFGKNSIWFAEHELQLERGVKYLDDYKKGPIKKKKERGITL